MEKLAQWSEKLTYSELPERHKYQKSLRTFLLWVLSLFVFKVKATKKKKEEIQLYYYAAAANSFFKKIKHK